MWLFSFHEFRLYLNGLMRCYKWNWHYRRFWVFRGESTHHSITSEMSNFVADWLRSMWMSVVALHFSDNRTARPHLVTSWATRHSKRRICMEQWYDMISGRKWTAEVFRFDSRTTQYSLLLFLHTFFSKIKNKYRKQHGALTLTVNWFISSQPNTFLSRTCFGYRSCRICDGNKPFGFPFSISSK